MSKYVKQRTADKVACADLRMSNSGPTFPFRKSNPQNKKGKQLHCLDLKEPLQERYGQILALDKGLAHTEFLME